MDKCWIRDGIAVPMQNPVFCNAGIYIYIGQMQVLNVRYLYGMYFSMAILQTCTLYVNTITFSKDL